MRDSVRTINLKIARSNRNENNKDRIWIRKDTTKRLNLRVRKTEPPKAMRVPEVRVKNDQARIIGIQATKADVVEVRGVQATSTSRPTQVIAGKPVQVVATTVEGREVKEIKLTPVKVTGTTKSDEVIEVKLLPSVKVSGTTIKTKN